MLHTKRRNLLSKGVLLPHDNACPHFAAATVESNQAVETSTSLPPPPIYSRTRFHGLSHAWATTRSLAWLKICQLWWSERSGAYVASNTTGNFLGKWDQKACEPLINVLWKKGAGVTVLRNDTLLFVTDYCTGSNQWTHSDVLLCLVYRTVVSIQNNNFVINVNIAASVV